MAGELHTVGMDFSFLVGAWLAVGERGYKEKAQLSRDPYA